jgi:hypothetical protein
MTTNVFQPLGFVLADNKFNSGAGHYNPYTILYSDTSIIGLNDLVKRSSGNTITKAGPTDTPIGMFKGWNFRTRSPYGGQMGGAADGSIVPWKKQWNGAVTLNTNQYIEALVDDDPSNLYRVQCFATTALAQSNIGNLVDMCDCPGGPDVNVFGRGKQGVTYPTTYYNITAYSVDTAGSGYTQNGVDLVNGQIMDIRPSDIVVTSGAIISITPLNQVQGLPTNTPTSTVQPKPGYGGSGAVVTTTKSGAQTAAQFRIERILEQPFRVTDAYNNTTGYDLTNIGTFPWLLVSYAKHARAGSALYLGT